MPFDHAAAKARARRIVHKTFSIRGDYNHQSLAAPIPLRVRYHSKQDLLGDLQNEGYPLAIDGIDRVIFDREELLQNGIIVMRGARVTIVDPNWPAVTLTMETREKSEGPVEEVWRVAKV